MFNYTKHIQVTCRKKKTETMYNMDHRGFGN